MWWLVMACHTLLSILMAYCSDNYQCEYSYVQNYYLKLLFKTTTQNYQGQALYSYD